MILILLAGFAGSAITVALLWPSGMLVALIAAPLGASLSAAAAAAVLARARSEQARPKALARISLPGTTPAATPDGPHYRMAYITSRAIAAGAAAMPNSQKRNVGHNVIGTLTRYAEQQGSAAPHSVLPSGALLPRDRARYATQATR